MIKELTYSTISTLLQLFSLMFCNVNCTVYIVTPDNHHYPNTTYHHCQTYTLPVHKYNVVSSLNTQTCTSVLYSVEISTLPFNNGDNSNDNNNNQLLFY